ncbi:MAG: BrnT family toxin [Azonexus sp.]|nr:BrnT family toxin [Azonexus sp.]
MITFDEKKRARNLDKHGIDLSDCESVFDYPMLTTEDDRFVYGEQRFKSLGWLTDRVVVLIWTDRDLGPHLISCRYGDKDETCKYFAQAY